MDPNIAALLETMKEQQQQFMQTLAGLTKAESITQVVSSPSEFKSFDKSKEKWEQYYQRLQQHFALHNVSSPEKKKAFLFCLDPETYSLLQNLFRSSNIIEQSFDDLMLSFNTTFNTKSEMLSFNTHLTRKFVVNV